MVMIFGIFTKYRVHSIHIAQRAMAQQHCPKLPKITDHDFSLPLADFCLYVTCFVFIKNPRAQRIMSEHFVLIIINRNKKSLRIVNLDDFRFFYKLSCSYSPAANGPATLSKFVQNYWWRFLVAACRLPLAASTFIISKNVWHVSCEWNLHY